MLCFPYVMNLNANDFCRIAADLTAEHGRAARDHARRLIEVFEREGEAERARFWCTLAAFIDDIALKRLDPDAAIVIH